MNKKTLFFTLVCSVALNFGFVGVYVHNTLNRPQAMAPRECPFTSEHTHLYATLGLDKTQLERMEPLARDFHEKIRTTGGQIIEQRNKLVDAMAREDVNMSTIDAIHQSIATRQTAMQQLVVGHILDMKAIMTPEQRERFFSAMRRSLQARTFLSQ